MGERFLSRRDSTIVARHESALNHEGNSHLPVRAEPHPTGSSLPLARFGSDGARPAKLPQAKNAALPIVLVVLDL
jgi:hypothetical protein